MKPFTDIFFDCDSTLIRVESLDWMAERRGVGTEVKVLTEASMNGEVPLEAVLKKKMDLIRPDQALIDRFIEELPSLLVPDAAPTITNLQQRGKRVWMLTSNVHPLADAVARLCNIQADHVLAGELLLHQNGTYRGLDTASPLTKSDGKAVMIQQIKTVGQRIAMIGDGATDLACKPYVDLFIGFGGVVAREAVLKDAHVIVREPRLSAVLEHLLTEEERERIN